MKICNECGRKYDDNASFCEICGRPLSVKKKKKIFNKIILAFLLIVVIIGGIIVTKLLWNKDSNGNENASDPESISENSLSGDPKIRVIAYFKEGKFSEAEVEYVNNFKYGDADKSEVLKEIVDLVEKNCEDYKNDKVEFDYVEKSIESAKKMDVDNTEDYITDLINIKNAKKNFNNGNGAFEKGEYYYAITCFDKIKLGDVNYVEAMAKKDEAADAYKKSLLSTAQDYLDKKEYNSALQTLTGQTYFKNDEAIENEIKVIKEARCDDILVELAQYDNNKEYDKAIELIEASLIYFDDTSELNNKKEIYKGYIEEKEHSIFLASAQEYYNSGDYYSAFDTLISRGYYDDLKEMIDKFTDERIKLSDEVLISEGYQSALISIADSINVLERCGIIDEYSVLYAKQEEYREYIPESLFEMDRYKEDVEKGVDIKDIYKMDELKANNGTVYDNVYLVSAHSLDVGWGETHYDYTLQYRLNGKYDMISGTFFLRYLARDTDKTARFEMYGDDVLLAATEMGYDIDPYYFEADITGVKDLKIVVKNITVRKDFANYYGAAFSNVLVRKLPNNGEGKWMLDGNYYWYLEADGSYPSNTWKSIDGKIYYFDENGYMCANTWVANRYLLVDGSMAVNQKIGNYYVNQLGLWKN